jgi:hypothetical protein
MRKLFAAATTLAIVAMLSVSLFAGEGGEVRPTDMPSLCGEGGEARPTDMPSLCGEGGE